MPTQIEIFDAEAKTAVQVVGRFRQASECGTWQSFTALVFYDTVNGRRIVTLVDKVFGVDEQQDTTYPIDILNREEFEDELAAHMARVLNHGAVKATAAPTAPGALHEISVREVRAPATAIDPPLRVGGNGKPSAEQNVYTFLFPASTLKSLTKSQMKKNDAPLLKLITLRFGLKGADKMYEAQLVARLSNNTVTGFIDVTLQPSDRSADEKELYMLLRSFNVREAFERALAGYAKKRTIGEVYAPPVAVPGVVQFSNDAPEAMFW